MSQRLDLKSHSCLTSSFFYPAPSTPFLVPPRGTSLINHLFLNAQLGVCFWGSPPEEHNQISWWVLVFTSGVRHVIHIYRVCVEFQSLEIPLRYPCWEPWPCAQKSRGCRTNRGPACDLHHSRLWSWSSNEHHTNRHDFSSDRLFYCYLIFPIHLSIFIMVSCPESWNCAIFMTSLPSYMKYFKIKIETGTFLSFAIQKYILGLHL